MQPTQAEALTFESRYTEQLPGDPDSSNRRRQVNGACYSRVPPTRVTAPCMVAWSPEVAELLDFPAGAGESELMLRVMAGNELLPGMQPYASCYGGHQFGVWAGQLGDGRAINLGERVNRRGQRWVLQLKGAGATPYSRSADGLAVLRSSIREFLCSEAMHHLGVPTTRALSLVTTGEDVLRDMFYDGHPKPEPGAVVCRVAPSFTRFGNFEIFAAREDFDVLKRLADYTIRTDFPHLGEPSRKIYIEWFKEVSMRTVEMIVHWMRVGFVHGVMNTDNMSILGLTIDYGPYGWLEDYDPDWTPNTTDAEGRRYRFGNQPGIAQWNLIRLANAIYPLIGDAEPLEQALADFKSAYSGNYQTMMSAKLGCKTVQPDADRELTEELLAVLRMVETDMTLFFRALAEIDLQTGGSPNTHYAASIKRLGVAWYQPDQVTGAYRERLRNWIDAYRRRLDMDNSNDAGRRDRMNAVNPKYVLRNYLAQLAIDKSERGDHSLVNELLELLRHPYQEQPEKQRFAEKRPDWARHRPGCSMLSCSS